MVELGAAFTPYITQYGEYYRIFTSMFMHFGIEHLISNMLALMVLGEALERYVGKIRFLIIYLLSGIIGGIVSVASYALRDRMVVSAGASGAVFGVLGAILVVTIFGHIRSGEVRIDPRRLIMFALLSILSGFNDTGIDNYAHIGGLVSGIIIALIMVLITDRYKSAK
nr:rhomboid family intramembrane serine protease [Falcatimonas sp. MSJ-15]